VRLVSEEQNSWLKCYASSRRMCCDGPGMDLRWCSAGSDGVTWVFGFHVCVSWHWLLSLLVQGNSRLDDESLL